METDKNEEDEKKKKKSMYFSLHCIYLGSNTIR